MKQNITKEQWDEFDDNQKLKFANNVYLDKEKL